MHAIHVCQQTAAQWPVKDLDSYFVVLWWRNIPFCCSSHQSVFFFPFFYVLWWRWLAVWSISRLTSAAIKKSFVLIFVFVWTETPPVWWAHLHSDSEKMYEKLLICQHSNYFTLLYFTLVLHWKAQERGARSSSDATFHSLKYSIKYSARIIFGLPVIDVL